MANCDMKIHSSYLITANKTLQIKTTKEDATSYLWEWLLSKRLEKVLERMWWKGDTHKTVGENVNCCSHYGKQYGNFSKT